MWSKMEIEKICTLCMRKCETFKCIDRNTKNILDLFLQEMDFSIIQEPVICEKCAETLAECFDFKTTCLHTYDYLVSFVNNKDGVKLDLNDLFQSRSMTDTDTPEDQDICGFCMGLVKSCSAISLYIKDEDYKFYKMVQQCLPELDLSVIKEPVICAYCHSSLESCFRFVTDCLTAEQRIRQYRENLDMSSKGQIELIDLLHPAIKTEKTNDVDSNAFDIVKIEKQICEDGEYPEQNEMVSGVNIIKSEQKSCVNENSNNIESVNETIMALDNPKDYTGQQWLLKNVFVWEEESNKISAIKIEETLCDENETKRKDDSFVEIEDKTCLINEEIEIKTNGHDFNRFEKDVVMTTPTVNTKLNEKCLMQHLLNHKDPTGLKTYKCDSCTYWTMCIGNLKKHTIKHKDTSQDRMYKCASSTFQTSYKFKLQRHSRKHKDPSDVTMYKCDYCTYQTSIKYELKRHSRKHKDPSEVTMYKCGFCTYQTRYRNVFNRHSLKHKDYSEVMVHKCDFCSHQTIYKTSLKRHLLQHKDPSQVTMYKCGFCTFQTIYKRNLIRHVLKHKDPSELMMYKCNSCTYQTRFRSTFNSHLLKHKDPSEVTMFKCGYCTFQTIHKSNLKNHSLQHKRPGEVTMHKCGSCAFETIYKYNLNKHLLKH